MKDRIHKKLLSQCEDLEKWYADRLGKSSYPFYASFDIRDAGFKIGNIDGNIFPAGFNNICQMDKDSSPELVEQFLKKQFPQAKNILLLTEDHLKNLYYWENVITLQDLLREAGHTVIVGMIGEDIGDGAEITSFSGKSIRVERVHSEGGKLMTRQGVPDLVISNNDFSNEYGEMDFSNTQMTPFRELGWYRRKKHTYFDHYNHFAAEFAELIKEDPWLFQVETKRFEGFEVGNEESRKDMAVVVDDMLSRTKKKYEEHQIEATPNVFVKNNSGTYGLGIITAESGEDVISWNYKDKKKMKAAKGGGGIREVIIQEGIPTILSEEGATAEPVLYMIGSELAGGFLRTHTKKSATESLNSPGAVYKRLCLSDLRVSAEGCVLENVYGWVAKLGFLAISQEAQSIKN